MIVRKNFFRIILVLLALTVFACANPLAKKSANSQAANGITFLDEEKQPNDSKSKKHGSQSATANEDRLASTKQAEGIVFLDMDDQVNELSGMPLALRETTQQGKASYYADSFAGKRTASGEKYDPEKFTAAHRSLPFGTRVRVTNLYNDKSVIVRINDRGPFIKARIIDLSRAAAEKLEMIDSGVAEVLVEIIK